MTSDFLKHCQSINGEFVPVSEHRTMKRTGDVKGKLHASLTSTLYGGKRSTSRVGRFISGERYHGSLFLGRWEGRRASLYVVAKKDPSQSRESHTDRLAMAFQITVFIFILSRD
jgi:hypothetical protein